MADQKIENLLNLALSASEEEREKSLELDVGYYPVARTWEVIIKYSGTLGQVREIAESVVELSNEFAIVTVREDRLEALAGIEAVEYIEKPKRLFFQVENGRRVSCMTSVQIRPPKLYGTGVLVAIIDSGIDYANLDFRNADGTTKIYALWDQTIPGNPPEGYVQGTEYTQEKINEALQQENRTERMKIVPSEDRSGHGTAVAGIAAGNGRGSKGARYQGVASESGILVVKLGTPREEGFPRTTELMQAIDYVVKKAQRAGRPVAINISFGNTYGSHTGTSLLERFIADIANLWKSVICIGMGNEGASAGHTAGTLEENTEERIPLAVQMKETAINVQIWKSYHDIVDISLISPAGVQIGPIPEVIGTQRFVVGDTEILLYYGEPSPFHVSQEIFIEFLPKDSYITPGIWQFVLTPRKIVTGEYDLWLPSENVLNRGTAFRYPTERGTLTIPSTSQRVISVGAYDSLTFAYADFSGRGGLEGESKPDLVAPGVDITAPTPSGIYQTFTGTSFATPFVSGAAALMMEWGIVRGNDPYLYGEKVKAYLRRGARPLPGFTEYPNPQVGYGALCLRDSLPL
ncbi:S8 family peptidase [Faecalimonas umbilicata]|uniref:S8 family peptidase n=1 Tax=Faecalimonas umbilicata TaxID=1912855 RepID=UPI002A8197B4|nr:S8 family peptidase [Faecalimonas umbilicata]MDY4596145.1 S8 family peptidase [Faecalimonas umbilicata]